MFSMLHFQFDFYYIDSQVGDDFQVHHLPHYFWIEQGTRKCS